jgi:hypothetical protein
MKMIKNNSKLIDAKNGDVFSLPYDDDQIQMIHLEHRDKLSHWCAAASQRKEFTVPLGLVSSVKAHQDLNLLQHD